MQVTGDLNMELKIYEIPHEIQMALNALEVDEETGEIVGWEKLDALTESATVKIANTARYIRHVQSQIEAMKVAKANIDARLKTAQRFVDWLSVKTVEGLLSLPDGKSKVEEPDIKVSARPSDVVLIDDEKLLDEKFFNIKIKQEKNVSKTAIKDAIKAGEEVKGARLVKSYKLQIK